VQLRVMHKHTHVQSLKLSPNFDLFLSMCQTTESLLKGKDQCS
jgi:hypothetical protein